MSFLSKENCMLCVIDMQEKLAKVMQNLDSTTKNINLLIKSAKELDVPIFYTEQYPKGLGETIEPLKSLLADTQRFDKMSFSALEIPEIKTFIVDSSKTTIVLCGIESHICVLSTTIDLLEKGYNVVIAKDAVTSRETDFYNTAINFYNSIGAKVVPSETIVFYWLKFAGTESFKKLQKVILGKD